MLDYTHCFSVTELLKSVNFGSGKTPEAMQVTLRVSLLTRFWYTSNFFSGAVKEKKKKVVIIKASVCATKEGTLRIL